MKSRFALAAALLFLPSLRAHADEQAHVRLEYVRANGADLCPDETHLREGVSARLGWNPFRADASKTIRITITRNDNMLAMHLEAWEDDERVGMRDIASSTNDCSELASATELQIAIAVDPLGMIGEHEASAPPLPPSPSLARSDEEPTATPTPSPAEPLQLAFEGSLGVSAAAGTAPTLIFGASLSTGVRFAAFSLALEGRADAPSSMSYREGEVKTSLLLASMVPCYRNHSLALCGVLSLGALRGEGSDLAVARKHTTLFASVAARIAWRIQLSDPLWLGAHLDLGVPLTRTTLQVSGEDAWTTAPFWGGIGIELGVAIPSQSD